MAVYLATESLFPPNSLFFSLLAGNLRWRLVRNGLHPQPASPVSTRQKVKSARNRADPYIRLLLGTQPKKYDTLAG